MIDFWMDFLSILAPTWDPTWGNVGYFFGKNEAALWDARLFLVGSLLFSDFEALLAPFWLQLGSIWEVLGSILEGSGVHFGRFWAPFWKVFGAHVLVVDGLVGSREALRISIYFSF